MTGGDGRLVGCLVDRLATRVSDAGKLSLTSN